MELIEFIRLGLIDGGVIKPARAAGLTDARRQVEILQQAGMMFLASGLTEPDVPLAASLQFFDALGLKYPAGLNGPEYLRGSFLKTPLKFDGDRAAIPTGYGLGVNVDEARVREAAQAYARAI